MEALTLLWQVRDGTGFVYTVLDYLLPLLLYCAWSAMVFAELAWSDVPRSRIWGWSLATIGLPFVGSALFLLAGPSRLDRSTRLAVVGGGSLLVAAGLALTILVLR